jgi:hypothetical protein
MCDDASKHMHHGKRPILRLGVHESWHSLKSSN